MRRLSQSNFPFHWECLQTAFRIVRIVVTMFIHTNWFYATAINFILYANRLMSSALFSVTEKIFVKSQKFTLKWKWCHDNNNNRPSVSYKIKDILSNIFWKNYIVNVLSLHYRTNDSHTPLKLKTTLRIILSSDLQQRVNASNNFIWITFRGKESLPCAAHLFDLPLL